MIQLELYHGFIGTYALAVSSKAVGTFAANVIYRLKKMADFKNAMKTKCKFSRILIHWCRVAMYLDLF